MRTTWTEPRARTPWVFLVGFALLVIVGAMPRLAAQVADATIEVIAVDASAAVLPGVTVTLTRPDTGFTQTVVTDTAGVARALALPPGRYNVRIELSGFATIAEEGVTVRVGQTARLNVTMRVASVAETVNVVGQVPLVDVYKTDSSTNIVPEQIESLPVPGPRLPAARVPRPRACSASAAATASSATVRSSAPAATRARPRSWSTAWTSPIRRSGWRGRASARTRSASSASIANRFDTEIGGSAGGALSIVTKSGTNDAEGIGVRLLPRQVRCGRRARSTCRRTTTRDSSSASRSAGRSSRTGRTSSPRSSRSTRTRFSSSGQVAPSPSQAADLPFPLNQSLVFAGVDHRFSDAQNLRVKFVYERYRQENFRVGGAGRPAGRHEPEPRQLERERDAHLDARRRHAEPAVGPGRPAQVRGAEQLDRRSPSTSRAATRCRRARTSSAIRTTPATSVEVRDTFFMHVGSGKWAQDAEVRRRRCSTSRTSGTSRSIRAV